MRALADQAFSRAASASLVESYIIHDDDVGEQFARALIARARDGVRVRVIYDWMGGFGKTSRRFWKRLRAGGVDVRCYNPPHVGSPFGWLSRDHRKMLTVDDTGSRRRPDRGIGRRRPRAEAPAGRPPGSFASATRWAPRSVLLAGGALVALVPRLLAYPMAAVAMWVAGALLYRGYSLYRSARRERSAPGGG